MLTTAFKFRPSPEKRDLSECGPNQAGLCGVHMLESLSSPRPCPRILDDVCLFSGNEVILFLHAVLLPAATLQNALPILIHRRMAAKINGCILGIQIPVVHIL